MSDPASLDRLHDIVVPPPAPWWPPAPAWWWLLGLLIILAVAGAIQALRQWQRHRYRREALAELLKQEAALFDPAQRAAALATLAELLKRVALTAWPRKEVAALTGAEWAAFLDRTSGSTAFAQKYGSILEQASYDPRTASALDESSLREMLTLVRHWLRDHRKEAGS